MYTINENNVKDTVCYFSSFDSTFLYFTNLVGYQVQILELSGPEGDVIHNLTIGGNRLISSYRYEFNYAKIITIPVAPVNAISMHLVASPECANNIFLLTPPLSRFDSTLFEKTDLQNSCIFFGSQNVTTTIFNNLGSDITIYETDGSTSSFPSKYAESNIPVEEFIKVNSITEILPSLYIYTSDFQPYNETFYFNNITNRYGATYLEISDKTYNTDENNSKPFSKFSIVIICIIVVCLLAIAIGVLFYFIKSKGNKYTKIPQEFL